MTRLLAGTLAVALLLVLDPAPADARSGTLIRACVKKKGGAMRMLLKRSQRCRRTERRISWNATGVQGLPGPAGPARPIEGTAAGGGLAGTYPNPMIAAGAVGAAAIAASLLDGDPGMPTLRSLGTGASQAVSNADPRLADPRPPTGPAGGDLAGSYPNPELGTNVVTSSEVATGSLRLSDTSVVSFQFDADPGSIAAGTCVHMANLFGSAIDVGDVATTYLPDSWDARIHSTSRRVTAGGTTPVHACNIGAIGLNPVSGRVQVVIQR